MAATLDARLRLDSSQFSGGMDRALREANSFTGRLSAQFATLRNVLGVGVVGGFASGLVGDLFQAAMEAEKLQAALSATTGSRAMGEDQLKQVKKLAGDIGLGVQEAAKAMIQFQSAGMSAADSMTAIKSGFNAILASGGGANEFSRFAIAIQQLRSSPKPLQEEINQLREALPTTAKLMQEAFGATRAEDIQKLNISGKEFVSGFLAQLQNLPQIGETMEKQIGRVKQQFQDFKAEIGSAAAPVASGAMTAASTVLSVVRVVADDAAEAWAKILGYDVEGMNRRDLAAQERRTQAAQEAAETKKRAEEEKKNADALLQSTKNAATLREEYDKMSKAFRASTRALMEALDFQSRMDAFNDQERTRLFQEGMDETAKRTREELDQKMQDRRERQAEADNAFVGPRQQSPEEANAWRELARREAMTKEDRRSFRQQQREEKENFRKAADRKSRDEFREEQKKARERAFDDQKNGKFFDAEGTRRSIREKNRAEAEQARKDGNQILKDIWTELKRLATA